MAFKFNTEKTSVKVMDRLELLQAQEELNQAFMDLTDAQKGMTEVCEVMENIQTSVDLITKYGAAGVEQLNVDGSLEALLQVPAKLITAEKAQEGLGEAAKAAWEKLKEWVGKIIELVKRAANWFMEKVSTGLNRLNIFKKAYEDGKKEGVEEYNKEFMNAVLPENTFVTLSGVYEAKIQSGIAHLVDDLAKFADIVNSKKTLDDPELDRIGEALSNTSIFDEMENAGWFLRCDGTTDTFAKAGYSNPDNVIAETEGIINFIKTSVGKLTGAMDKLNAVTAMSEETAPDSDMVSNLKFVANCVSKTITFVKSINNVIDRTMNAIDAVQKGIAAKHNVNKFFTEQDLSSDASSKTKLMRIIDEVGKGSRSADDATAAANELKKLKPELFETDDGAVSSDENDINVVMGALATNFSMEKIKLAIALASQK